MSKLIVALQDAGDSDRDEIGGKAWGLARLIRGGFQVPRGFVIATDACSAFLDSRNAGPALAEADAALGRDPGPATIRSYQRRITDLLGDAPVPTFVTAHVHDAFRALSVPTVAVRSSAPSEDSEKASFAGQYRSFMNVTERDLVSAVRACWLSLWTTPAIEYRRRHQIREADARMAVVVQQMIPARVSGVAFSADAVRHDRNVIVVNVIAGAGEPLVGGEATPIEFRLPKRRTLRNAFRFHAPRAPLTRADQRRLRRVVIAIESIFGIPQDIEFALGEGDFFILQSRPISAWQETEHVPTGIWTRTGFEEWLQRPVSPLFRTLLLPALANAADELIERRWKLRRPNPTWAIIDGFFYTRAAPELTGSLPLVPIRVWRDADELLASWHAFVAEYTAEVEALSGGHPSVDDPSAAVAHVEKCVALAARCWAWVIVTGAAGKLSSYLAARLARNAGLKREDAFALLNGFESKSVEADQALWDLAQTAQKDAAVTRALMESTPEEVLTRRGHTTWAANFRSWLATYGVRVFDLDIAEASLEDRPEIALDLIKAHLSRSSEAPRARVAAAASRRARAEEAILRWRDTPRVRRTIRIATGFAKIREDRPFFLHMLWPVLRRELRSCGDWLANAGVLSERDDVFFLERSELVAAMQKHDRAPAAIPQAFDSVVHARREMRARQTRLRPKIAIFEGVFARLIGRLLRTPPPALPRPGNRLTGVPGSAGYGRGRARLIHDESDFGRFQPGEILLARYTTTAWTPLLAMAGGIVTEVGGSLAHAAVIAREYGIPAVLGVEGVLVHVRDGQEIEIDGTQGVVTVIDKGGSLTDVGASAY